MGDSLFIAILIYVPMAMLIPVVCASACMHIAYKRGRNPGWFFALGFFLGPIGLIVSGMMSDRNRER